MVKIFVGNLNPQSKPIDLRKQFEPFGTVTECDIHMENDSDVEKAIKGLQNCILDGVKINVERSHGKRGGPGPMRRRGDGRFRNGLDDRYRGPPPPRNINPPPPPRMGRYGPSWDDGYHGPYGPRGDPRGYDYSMNGGNGRYPPERDSGRPLPRIPIREPLPPSSGLGYRGLPLPERMPSPIREYQKGPPLRSSYDSYADYDRCREPAPLPRSNDYYDNYGSYSSGTNYEAPAYDSGYDYGYYDYGLDRSPAPQRSGYTYGRP